MTGQHGWPLPSAWRNQGARSLANQQHQEQEETEALNTKDLHRVNIRYGCGPRQDCQDPELVSRYAHREEEELEAAYQSLTTLPTTLSELLDLQIVMELRFLSHTPAAHCLGRQVVQFPISPTRPHNIATASPYRTSLRIPYSPVL